MGDLSQLVITGGAVGTVVFLLFRTYWKAEDRDESFIERLLQREKDLTKENAALRKALRECEDWHRPGS